MQIMEVTLRYTEDDLKRLVEGPRIKRADWVKCLPLELRSHLTRLLELQKVAVQASPPSKVV